MAMVPEILWPVPRLSPWNPGSVCIRAEEPHAVTEAKLTQPGMLEHTSLCETIQCVW